MWTAQQKCNELYFNQITFTTQLYCGEIVQYITKIYIKHQIVDIN